MLLSNSRIEKSDKILFYEQDILLDDHVYSGDIEVTVSLDYVTPGIGIALVSGEGVSLSEDGDTYLFRIGHSDYSIIKRSGSKTEVLENGSVVDVKPFQKNLVLKLKFVNNRAFFYVNNEFVTKRYLPTELNSFVLGYYSNAGNIINTISISSEVPEGWVVNMKHTSGGYIKFGSDKFTITNCADKAEVEQVRISLPENTESNKYYYLKYETEDVNGAHDIVPYVFQSDDNRYSNKEKNLLDKYNRFRLKRDSEVSIKFVGTVGTIKNIQVTESQDDFYVGTDYQITDIRESLIKIKTEQLEKIEFSGIIYGTPPMNLEDEECEKFGIVRDSLRVFYPQQHKIKIGQEYHYDYVVNIGSSLSGSKLIATRNDEVTTVELTIVDSLTIFENMDGIVDKLILYKKDGTTINVIEQKTKKQYVPATIKSPIIVTAENGEPLDLSSSYRIYKNGESVTYKFTNTEREIFEPANRISVEKPISSKLDTVVVYGVLHESDLYPENILFSKGENMKEIDGYCDAYEIIRESELYRVDKDSGILVLTEEDDHAIQSKYQKLVVDYLKNDSYAVNYKHELGSYEVDISTRGTTNVFYDGISSNSENGVININNYKLLNTAIKNNSYVVLRGR